MMPNLKVAMIIQGYKIMEEDKDEKCDTKNCIKKTDDSLERMGVFSDDSSNS